MKGYKVERRPTGLRFVCSSCGHSVEVNQFVKVDGGPAQRTQAAAAMNQHRAQAHKAPHHFCTGPECDFCRKERSGRGFA